MKDIYAKQQLSHCFKFINALLCVALSDLSESLVFITACFNVLSMKDVVLGFLAFVSGLGQFRTQGLPNEIMMFRYLHF